MNYTELVYVSDTPLNCISNVQIGWFDVSKNSGRETTNADGTMILNVINQKYRLDITTTPMNQSELGTFFQKIKLNTKFTVNFFNPYTGERQSCQMYRGDRNVNLKWKLANGSTLYDPITFSLIEL